MPISLTGHDLTIEQVVAISRHHERVTLDPKAEENLKKSRDFVDSLVANGTVVYGITTGFGNFKSKTISPDQTEQLQANLIRSHATGVGTPLPEELVRASIVVRINSLLQGYSGIRPVVAERLMDLLNYDIYPYVPSQGSVGSSGDLAPLCHIILVIMGEGEVISNHRRVPSKTILNEKGIAPIILQSKEGLALSNGTAVQTGIGCMAVYDAERLAKEFDIALAMSLEAMMGSTKAYDPRVHALRPHPGQIQCADNVRRLTQDSEIIRSHKNCDRVQDSYSLRCAPQVHGASRTTITHVQEVVTRELNSVTDNPLLFPDDGEAISAGHFHGEPIAQAMDYLKIGVCELANISERRTAKIVDPAYNEGLPAFLIPTRQGGLSSGFMIPQYVAAALVSENKVLAHPASVDSIPTSANQEDHVSMGTIAARHAIDVAKNARQVLAIELLCAAQALDFRTPLRGGHGVQAAYALIREHVSFMDTDRVIYPDIKSIDRLLSGQLLQVVEDRVGKLQ